jgi:hypothetical protein
MSRRQLALRIMLITGAVLVGAIALRPPVQAQTSTCEVAYNVRGEWNTGFTADVTIKNTGAAAINGWTLAWTFPGSQRITYLWSGSYTQSGAAVSVTNAGYNGSIGPNGGTVNFGFNGSYSGPNAKPASFTLNGVTCGGGGPTSTPTRTPTRTPTPTNTPTRTPTGGTPSTPTRTPTPDGSLLTGNATWFDGLGSPYGGCGLPQSVLDSQNFVALNVQNSPGDYTTFHTRPIPPQYASQLGFFNNGLNCGRWVHVVMSDNCNGINDGAMNQPFCRGGSGWYSDAYNGAELDMIVADSCYDGNAWCRDDPNHLDLAKASLNLFVKNGQPVGNLFPNSWNNRHVQWRFIEAPNYTGDIRIGFILSAQIWWPAISITHLKNGIHGVEYFNGTTWVKAQMNGDMGQSYIIGPTEIVNGVAGSNYRIRVYDASDQLINNGRIYNFSFPASCGTNCSPTFTEVTYTVE